MSPKNDRHRKGMFKLLNDRLCVTCSSMQRRMQYEVSFIVNCKCFKCTSRVRSSYIYNIAVTYKQIFSFIKFDLHMKGNLVWPNTTVYVCKLYSAFSLKHFNGVSCLVDLNRSS